MTPLAFRVARGALLLACLALALTRRRPELRPVAVCLLALACLDCARLLPLPARLDAWLWLCWPAPVAALAWRVWRGR